MRKRKSKIPRWKSEEPPFEVGKDGFEYKNAKQDYEGWIDPNIFRPLPYELVAVMTNKRKKLGWWTGIHWDGLRILPEEKVLKWKKEETQEEEKCL